MRRMKNNGPLYLVCPEHGVIRPPGQAHQEYILSHANLPPAPALDEPDPEPESEPEPAPEPDPTPAPSPDDPEPMSKKKADDGRKMIPIRGGIISFLNDWDLD